MKCNSGKIDRVVRIVVGLGVLSLAFIGPESPLGYIGLVPILTGATGICPLYVLLGFNTCSVPQKGRPLGED